jgi:hypothetical protein
MFLVMGQSKWIIAKKNLWNICAWDAPQPIKLITMNHNKYPSSSESLGKKWGWAKLRIEILVKEWGGTKCT